MEWLNRLLSSKPTVKPQKRCGCGRFCKSHDEKPDATARLIKDMSAAGLYVPPAAIAMVERMQGGGL